MFKFNLLLPQRIQRSNLKMYSNNVGFKSGMIKFCMELSIIVNCFNQIFCEWMFGIELSLAVSTIVNVTVAALTGQPRAFISSAVGFITLMYTISMSGQVFTLSSKILSSDWSNGQRMRQSWVHRAFRPLRVEFGYFFYADNGLLLTVLSALLTNSANLLVVLRNP